MRHLSRYNNDMFERIFFIIFVVISTLLIVWLIASYIVYRMTFYNDQKNKKASEMPLSSEGYQPYYEEMLQMCKESFSIQATEEVYLLGHNRKKIHASLFIKDIEKPFIIEVHGYKGSARRDFSGGLPDMLKAGYNVLLVDHRGHGRSYGKTITFGINERKDLLIWINYLNEKFNSPNIFFYGISMGGFTVLSMLDYEIPENVRGIMSDCPYRSPKGEICKVVKDMKLSPKFFYPLLWSAAFLYAHFNLNKGDACESVKKSTKPILLIHGTGDLFVPHQNSVEIYQANKEKITFISVKNAPHGISYIVDRPRVTSAVMEFIKKYTVQEK